MNSSRPTTRSPIAIAAAFLALGVAWILVTPDELIAAVTEMIGSPRAFGR